jgi:hypothetical protein
MVAQTLCYRISDGRFARVSADADQHLARLNSAAADRQHHFGVVLACRSGTHDVQLWVALSRHVGRNPFDVFEGERHVDPAAIVVPKAETVVVGRCPTSSLDRGVLAKRY